VAIIGSVIFTLFSLSAAKQNPSAFVLPLVIGLAAVTVLVLTYKLKFFTQASYERALQLAQHMGLNDMGLLMIEVTYGRMNAEQAQQELARREAAQQPVDAELPEFLRQ
jgi:hypothetical protein